MRFFLDYFSLIWAHHLGTQIGMPASRTLWVRHWHHISGGFDVANDKTVQKWFQGPPFSLKPGAEWSIQHNKGSIL